uniref:Zinc finger protein ArfGAP-3 n=1 Tax=Phallusia mammillata TaxID=59560 RepID=A0A6F9D765_9ASCI|nr:zinc finger protein ArfGAP-3 [Phallusia mammillata]
MSKPKFRPHTEVCADCGAPEPGWSSVNRGVYMCSDCAGIHRNLGRHVSQVKHVQKSSWHQNQLNMVHQLASVGANSIWEHSLLDPAQVRSGKRKPNPTDPAHTTKSEFIKAKYEQLAYVHRPPRRDDDDLGKQLHSSVRTANLDTSLRLLSLGAQANFFHTERGNTPLHVAAKAGQALQVELLVTYGADPAGLDTNRQTPEDLARAEGHTDLADRLVELQYELSDRLSNFVWNLKPDHKTAIHYAIPKSRDNGVGLDGRKRLQALSNQIFEELAMDVYDEVDRRETEQIWQETKQASAGKIPPTADHVAVPFLPVNPEYSTTRNQGRQKLARFSSSEFNVLVTDILHDIIRRQAMSDGVSLRQAPLQSPTVEDPIYDLPPDGNLDYQSIEDSARPPVSLNEFLALKQKLKEAEEQITKLTEQNKSLTNKATYLARQNHELTKKQQSYPSAFKPPAVPGKPPSAPHSPRNDSSGIIRPISVCNLNESGGSQSSLASGDHQRPQTIHGTPPGSELVEGDKENAETGIGGAKSTKNAPHLRDPSPHNSVGSDYDNHTVLSTGGEPPGARKGSIGTTDPGLEKSASKNVSPSDPANTNENNNTDVSPISVSPHPSTSDGKDSSSDSQEKAPQPNSLPTAEEVIRKTESVTRIIQQLLQAAQKSKIESYASCAGNIFTAVQEIIALFPEELTDQSLRGVINKLRNGAASLKNRCKEVSEQAAGGSSKQVTESIIKNAYEIAKAEKELVTMMNTPKATPTAT